MFRLLVVPISIGVMAFLFIYFIAAKIFTEPDIVSYVAEFALYLSNSYFESMPPVIVSFITNLNLAVVALTVGLLLTVVIQLVVIIGGTFIRLIKWIISYLQKDRSKEVVQDLSPIDIDSRFMSSGSGKKILGRGLDSIDEE
ncbi:MAG: hypothetical protein OEO19_06675 [Gammaproteobacteria bacterium]|nr:hypothetical protein [Gammaproteobacteria bacterium]MDH3450320.1 hypothetical protein [Gammaproteobacteria bacterium]